MKKLIPILFCTFLAAGCYEEIIIPVEEKEPVLVMNAQMRTIDEDHTVYLSVSHLSKVDPLSGASVQIYVNGSLVKTAMEDTEEGIRKGVPYRFTYHFKPGDEVRVEARKEPFFATSTVRIPEKAGVMSVDTSSVRVSDMDAILDYIQVKARFKDLPGETWYAVDHRMVDKWEFLDEEGNPVPEYTFQYEYYGYIDTDYDPVICEGAGSAGGDLASLLSAGNYYRCFSDEPIADQEYALRVMMSPSMFYLEKYPYIPYLPEGATYDTLLKMRIRVTRQYYFWLKTLDFSQYHYLKAMNNLETFGTDVSFLVEPTTLPSNVEGGLGFVGIEAVASKMYATTVRELGPMDSVVYY